MSKHTEDNTEKLLLEKEEISEASLDGVSGGKGGRWREFGKALSKSLGLLSLGTAASAATQQTQNQ